MFDKHQPFIYYRIIKGDFGLTIEANEGKGIFYAKNRLGMTEQQKELDVFKPIEITVIAPTPKISNNENK